MDEAIQADKTLDLCGWNSSWGILKAVSELRRLAAGEVLVVLATDPATVKNLPPILRRAGDEVVAVVEETERVRLYLRRGLEKA